jgi:hypothetical protein
MKKVLLILNEIFDYNATEMFCVSLARELHDAEIEPIIYAGSVTGNESTDRLHEKGIQVYDSEHNDKTGIPENVDAIIALDDWAIDNVPKKTKGEIKIKISNTSEVDLSVAMIVEKLNVMPKNNEEKKEDSESEIMENTIKAKPKAIVTKKKKKTVVKKR